MLMALILWFGAALGTAFAPDIYTFMVLRFFVSCGSYGTFLPSYIIGEFPYNIFNNKKTPKGIF